MQKQTSDSNNLKVLVVDDDWSSVETLVHRLKERAIEAEGINDPAKLFGWTRPERFAGFDIIFLDMHLGSSSFGRATSAADAILHIMTYCPTAKAIVFTHKDVTVEEFVRCIQLGALGFIPKTYDIDQFVLAANVYRQLGDEKRALEERIRSLWVMLEEPGNPAKGRHLEMLTTNLFNSIPGFKVVGNNSATIQGEIDLVVENLCDHQYWRNLNCLHLVVECKNQKAPIEKKAFHNLAEKVIGKVMCEVGILVSWSGFSSGFRALQSAQAARVKIYRLDHEHLYELVRRNADTREAYLRTILEVQF
jgi:ActR/RegA family two-component response regulator